jgi:hypothetical protein
MCSDNPFSDIPIVFEKLLAANTMLGSFVTQTEKKQIFPERFKPMSSLSTQGRLTNCTMAHLGIFSNKYF